ncbi:AIM24 family protein [soil metagenome]
MTRFRLENSRLLEVTLQNERVMTRAGSMVAYDGQMKFEKAILGGEGIFGALKRRVGGEGFDLMTTSGTGRVYVAQNAAEILLIPLQNDRIFIESSSVLAFDHGMRSNTVFAGLRGASSGQGLFTTSIEGTGNVAAISDGTAIALEVTQSEPLFVDPDAFIGYTGNVRQEFVFDVNWKTLVGRSSGESYQLKFTGGGVVYIQPSERR